MNIRKYSWAMLAALLLFSSCEKDTEPFNFAPTVTTGNATDLYRVGATLCGSVSNPNGYTLQEYGVQYSLYQSFSEPVNVSAPADANPQNFSVAISGLTPGTGYYYRTYAFSGYSTVYSEARSFTTTSTNAPVFGNTTVSDISLTGFDVNAELLDSGGSDLMMSGFIYRQVESDTDAELSMDTPGVSFVVTDKAFSTGIKDLYTGTLYAIRPFGVANGVGYGKIAYARTLTTDKTVLSSCTFSDSTMNSVRVEAHVLSAGTHPIVETGFCYSSESNQPTANNLTVSATSSGNTFSATLDELNSDTRYYVRAYAKSETGEYTYGETAEYVTGTFSEEETFPAWEYEILKKLYEETNGDNWTVNDNWLSDKPLNTWYGLTLDEYGYVQSIALPNNNLTGTLRIEEFQNLKDINVNDNLLESIYLKLSNPETESVELGNCVTNYGPISISGVSEVTIKDNKQIGSLVIDCNTLVVDGCDFGDVTTPFSTVNAGYVTIRNSTMFNCGLVNDYLIFENSKTTDTWFCVTRVRAELIDSYCSTICSWDFSTEAEIIVTNTTLIQPEWNEKKSGTYTFITDSEGWAKMFGPDEIRPVVLSDVTITDVTDTSFVVSAEITDNGGGAILDRGFCYVEGETVPTMNDNRVGVTDAGNLTLIATVSHLKADTQYTVCAYAVNELSEISYSTPLAVTTLKHLPLKDDAVFPDISI